MPKTVKLTYEYVKEFFSKNNCEMLDTYYKNARTHINYRCSCGNVTKIIFDSFRRGHRCKKCATKLIVKKQTLALDDVKAYFCGQGYELLETIYINARTKMKFKCSRGHIDFMNFNNFKTGKRCRKCSIQKRSGSNHYEWIKDRDLVASNDKFRQKCYKMLKYTLSQTGQLKSDRTHVMLGYSSNELYYYITSHDNWRHVKSGKWHLDHIFPIQAFVDYGIKNIELINCLDNLQPLKAVDNCSKGDRYDKEEFKKWLEGRGYEFN